MTFLLGFACASAFWIGFIWFAIWHSKRFPLVKPDEPEILAAETSVYHPSYGWRLVK